MDRFPTPSSGRRLAVGLLLPVLLAAGCKPKLPPHEAQAQPVLIHLLDQIGVLCDDLGVTVPAKWEEEARDLHDRVMVEFRGREVAKREGRKYAAEIALLDREAEARVRLLEGRTDPAAKAAREAYLAGRNFCALIAYPDVAKPSFLEGEIVDRRSVRSGAFRKLGTGAPPLDATGKAELAELEVQAAAVRYKPVPEAPVREPARPTSQPLYQMTQQRALSLTELNFFQDRTNMRIEGSVTNSGSATLEGMFATIELLDSSGVKTKSDIRLETRHMATSDSSRFSWVFPRDSSIYRCRVSFIDGNGTRVEASGPASSQAGVRSAPQ